MLDESQPSPMLLRLQPAMLVTSMSQGIHPHGRRLCLSGIPGGSRNSKIAEILCWVQQDRGVN